MDQYEFLKWVLKRFKKALDHNGSVSRFSNSAGYSSHFPKWRKFGVSKKVWKVLERDLVIAKLMGRIRHDEETELNKLKEIFKKDCC